MNLTVKNLTVNVAGKKILDGVNLDLEPGKLIALMGPNGSGKSSLAQVLMGNPAYEVGITNAKKPSVKIGKDELLGLTSDKRAGLGLFLAFQNPVSVPGVSVSNLLRTALSEMAVKGHNPALNVLEFNEELYKKTEGLGINPELLRRGLNEDFSGGEKKKLEMLQGMVLKPKFAVFDEIDTGLDVDALRTVAKAIAKLKKEGCGVLLITHYQRILKYAKPDYVYILVRGKIVEKGTSGLALEIEKNGYKKWLKD